MKKLIVAICMFVTSLVSNSYADGHGVKMGIILGFTGPIEKLNRGWNVDRVVVYIVEKYGSCIVLMDWDRTGGRLQRRLMDSMTSLDIKPCDELRRALSKAMKPDTMCVEDLPSFLGESDT